MALTAPTLCPRCDTPAIMTEHCVQCALQLRRCGACRGVAGPFDRYCGFCGHELLLGTRRSPAWRLWLLLALVPLAGGIALGLSPLGAPAGRALSSVASRAPEASAADVSLVRAPALGLEWKVPHSWTSTDYSADPAGSTPYLVSAADPADAAQAAQAGGNLALLRPQGSTLEAGRPPVAPSAVDPTDPRAVLSLDVGLLLAQPPGGSRLEVVRPVRPLTIGGRPAAEVVLRVIWPDGGGYYLERALAFAPLSGRPALVRMEAVTTAAAWDGGDDRRIEAAIQSARFS